MTTDAEYIANYVPGRLYLNPGKEGVYASLADDSEIVLDEIELNERKRIAISAFFVRSKADFGTYKITILKNHKKFGWKLDQQIVVSHLEAEKIIELNKIIAATRPDSAKRVRIDFGDLDLSIVETLLSSSRRSEVAKEISESNWLEDDIFAIHKKRIEMQRFRKLIESETKEAEWQSFFEENSWIFGFGLDFVFLEKVTEKLETVTTGASAFQSGKRTDALVKTRADISQTVLIEIKRHDTPLVSNTQYRSGTWSISSEVAGAVSQSQKTAFDFARAYFRIRLKDESGTDTPNEFFVISPKCYVIAGRTSQIADNEDKITCFEMFRRNLSNPEIITFDELYLRAESLIERLGNN